MLNQVLKKCEQADCANIDKDILRDSMLIQKPSPFKDERVYILNEQIITVNDFICVSVCVCARAQSLPPELVPSLSSLNGFVRLLTLESARPQKIMNGCFWRTTANASLTGPPLPSRYKLDSSIRTMQYNKHVRLHFGSYFLALGTFANFRRPR